jgi:hypothetical protein
MLAIKPMWLVVSCMDINLQEERNDSQRVGIDNLLRSFIPNFQMEALGVNATKSLFSSDLTKEVEIEDPSDLDLNLEEDT